MENKVRSGPQTVLLVLSLLVVLLTSFFCSLSEASLLSVSRVRIHKRAETSRSAQIVARMKERLDRPIAAILIVNTVANTGGAALAGREYERIFGGANMGLFTVLLTLAVLVVSELLPKSIGVQHALRTSLLVARPMQLLVAVTRPFTWLVELGARYLSGGKRPQPVTFSLEDLRTMARLAWTSKALGRSEHMIIHAASLLPNLSVRHIMIHREDIVFLSLNDSDEANLIKARRSMHSRLVLVRDTLDSVVGIVPIKELLWRLAEDRDELDFKRVIVESVREAVFVNANIEVTSLLQVFSEEHAHLALVREPSADEPDRVVGIVTLEDVVEELIGEIDDEYDPSPTKSERLGLSTWRFGGGTPWSEAARRLTLDENEHLPSEEERDLDGRYDMNDLAADKLVGRLRTGGVFIIGRWRFKVLRMRRGKVLQMEVRMIGATPNSIPPESMTAGEVVTESLTGVERTVL
ncbi:MAG: hemolysin family protein [Myxococcales bacterium]|nr:hemolysin family protein [Myxococcales bacterium]